MSADYHGALKAFKESADIKHLLLSDLGRKMMPAYGAMVTDPNSPVYRYGKRAYFILDRDGVARWMKVQDNPLDILDPDEVLKAVKESGAA